MGRMRICPSASAAENAVSTSTIAIISAVSFFFIRFLLSLPSIIPSRPEKSK